MLTVKRKREVPLLPTHFNSSDFFYIAPFK